MRGWNKTEGQSSSRNIRITWLRTSFRRRKPVMSISHEWYRIEIAPEKRERPTTSPFCVDNFKTSLRQRLDININLKRTCLLNAEQKPQIDCGAIRERRRERNGAGGQC